jgi:fatty-acyl-CoA synthase
VALNCAEPIHPATVRAFEERLAPYGLRPGTVIPAYGLAEISLAATIALPGSGLSAAAFDAGGLEEGIARLAAPGAKDARLIASGGVPVMGTIIRIVDRGDFRKFLPEERVGEIIARSPSVMAGLLREDGGLDAHENEWLATGDLGFIHDGKLYVSGRKKDLIIYNGRNLYPQHLEESVGFVEGVRDGLCAAVSLNTGEVRDELLIFAETNLSDPDRARVLGAAVTSAVLGNHGVRPDAVHLLEKHSLPRTTSGKVRRSRALELYVAGELRPVFSFRPGEAS